jgi:hypothetical protein
MHIHYCVKCNTICLQLKFRFARWSASARPCLSVGSRVSEKFMLETAISANFPGCIGPLIDPQLNLNNFQFNGLNSVQCKLFDKLEDLIRIYIKCLLEKMFNNIFTYRQKRRLNCNINIVNK